MLTWKPKNATHLHDKLQTFSTIRSCHLLFPQHSVRLRGEISCRRNAKLPHLPHTNTRSRQIVEQCHKSLHLLFGSLLSSCSGAGWRKLAGPCLFSICPHLASFDLAQK